MNLTLNRPELFEGNGGNDSGLMGLSQISARPVLSLSGDGVGAIRDLGNHVMKRWQSNDAQAFTRIELLVVLGVIVVMGSLLLPGMARAKQKAMRMQCTNNLKQLGMGFRFRAIQSGAEFSAQVSTNRHGALGLLASVQAFQYFQVMSNALPGPKLLVCPADTRVPARNFGPAFSNTNLSYFVGLDADERYPAMFLFGDRNLTNGSPLEDGMLVLIPNQPVGWTHELHNRQGNVGLADGSVQGLSNSRLSGLLAGTTNRLAMP